NPSFSVIWNDRSLSFGLSDILRARLGPIPTFQTQSAASYDWYNMKRVPHGGCGLAKQSLLVSAHAKWIEDAYWAGPWPEWDPCRASVRINHDCGRGYPSVGYMRKQLKPPRVRLASSGPCQCYLGLSSGLAIGLVGPEAYYNNTAQAQRTGVRLWKNTAL
ncbi:hypothetical protein Tco_1429577, partial [Tanacetum coccineum]